MPHARDTPPICVELLGPLGLVVDGEHVDVPGPKRRAVLALLALAEGRTVTVDQLLDALWPSEPPAAARAALHSHVSRLRGHLGPAAGRLQAVDDGYRLRLGPDELDVERARAWVADARRQVDHDPPAAYAQVRAARALWRGPPLAELADVRPVADRVVAFDELRREVDDLLVECGLAAGDAAAVAGMAAVAVAEQPLREPAVLALMRSLALTGRRADALRAGYEYRRRLQREAGLDPSPALGELERRLASQPDAPTDGRAPTVPVPITPLVGRESEVAALERLLANDRLVTIVGPGGVGKTRIAVDVAHRVDDATFLTLAPVTDPSAIPRALAATLRLDGVRGDPLPTCAALLAAGPRLLVVDNCEHLIAGVRRLVTTLLESCPQLVVLATSRERLALAGERQVRIGPLALPDPRNPDLRRVPAVAVFVERARRARVCFEPGEDDLGVIADIVRRLDGLPLAIELAAGRLSSLALADLHARLDRALDLLQDGGPAHDGRHRTLRATIEWSYALLAVPEQRLFRHLAVFADGVDLRTAEMVATDVGVTGDAAAALAHLVDASMLDAELDGAPRYRMLETVRSFALDQLEATDEAGEADERLMRWAVGLARWIDAALHTAAEAQANAQLRRELPNLRAAWGRARRSPTVDHLVEIAVALDDAAQWRDLPELWHWAEALAEDPRVATHPRAAAVLATASDAAWLLGHLDRAAQLAAAALDAARDDDGRWRALLALAVVELSRADFAAASAHASEAAALAPRPAHAHWVAALAAAYGGDLDRAEEILRAQTATSPTLQAEREYVAGEVASIAGRIEQAEHHYRRAVDLARDVGATFVVGIASLGLVAVRARAGRHADALRGYRELIEYWERVGNWIQVWTTLRNLATLLRAIGDDDDALYLEVAAEHASASPAVGDAPTRAASAHDRVTEADPAAATLRAEAAAANPTRVLDVARSAVDRTLRTLDGSSVP